MTWVILLGCVFSLPALPSGFAAEGYGPWRWSRELPQEARTETHRAHREAPDVDALFARRPSLRQVLEHLGPPDDFSRQFMYSRTEGTSADLPKGGTLRFLMSDGGEVQVATYDFDSVILAIRWSRTGEAKLLAK